MYWWREEDFDETINKYHIGDDLKDNKKIQRYLRKYYNNNHPIITKKRFDDIWIDFKLRMGMIRPDEEIMNILDNIILKKKNIKIEL